jgi:hypothetical protein
MQGQPKFSWALMLSIRATIRIISSNVALQSLLYPATHVVLGFIRCTSSTIWLPSQLLLLDCLLLLGNQTYIPIAAEAIRLLQAVLNAASAGVPPQDALPPQALRISKAALGRKCVQRENVIKRLLTIVSRAASLVVRHPSFPEWAAPLSRQLRYLCRYAPNRASKRMHSLAQAFDANTRVVLGIRSRMKLTPKAGKEVALELLRCKEVFPLEVLLSKEELNDYLEENVDEVVEYADEDDEMDMDDEEEEEEEEESDDFMDSSSDGSVLDELD